MLFYNKTETTLIQIGVNQLIINHLKPYPGWSKFFPIIKKNLQIYRDVANPKGLNSVKLRYINKFEVSKSEILKDYFEFYPQKPESFSGLQSTSAFLSQLEYNYENNQDKLIVKMGSTTPESENLTAILLDIDYSVIIPNKVSLDESTEWIDKQAHKIIGHTFEHCIKDKCRQMFGKTQ